MKMKMGVCRGVRGRKHKFSAAFQIIFALFPLQPTIANQLHICQRVSKTKHLSHSV